MSEATSQPQVIQDTALDQFLSAADEINRINGAFAHIEAQGAMSADAQEIERLRADQEASFREFRRMQPSHEALQVRGASVADELAEIAALQGRLMNMTVRELEEELVGDIKQTTGEPTSEEDIAREALRQYHELAARAVALRRVTGKLARAATLATVDVDTALVSEERRVAIMREIDEEKRAAAAPEREAQAQATGAATPAEPGERYTTRAMEVAAALIARQGQALTSAELAQIVFGQASKSSLVMVSVITGNALNGEGAMHRELERHGLVLRKVMVPNPSQVKGARKNLVAYVVEPLTPAQP